MNKQHKHPDDGNPAMSDAAEHAETGAEAERSGQGSAGGGFDFPLGPNGGEKKEKAELQDKEFRPPAPAPKARQPNPPDSQEHGRASPRENLPTPPPAD